MIPKLLMHRLWRFKFDSPIIPTSDQGSWSLSRTWSSTPSRLSVLTWTQQDTEKKRDHRLIMAKPSIQMLEISEGTRHTAGKKQIWGLPLHVILTHADGVRPHNPQTLHLGSHVHTHQGDPTSPDPVPGVTHPPWSGHCGCAAWAPNVWTSGVPGTS